MITSHDMNPFVIKQMEKEKINSQKISGQELKFLHGCGYRKNTVSIN